MSNGDALVAKYGDGWRWWPQPASRQGGSQRWIVPAVAHWYPAPSFEVACASSKARKSAL